MTRAACVGEVEMAGTQWTRRPALGLFFVLAIALSLAAGCGVGRQVREMEALANCEFRFEGLERATLAGVDLLEAARTGGFEPGQGALLLTSMTMGNLPLELTVQVGVRNPNDAPAAVNRLDWVLLMDENQMGVGAVTERVEIPARGGTAVVPVHFSTDLASLFSGQSAESLIGFALNLAGSGDRPSRVTIRVKPTVSVAGRDLLLPGYITLSEEFSGPVAE